MSAAVVNQNRRIAGQLSTPEHLQQALARVFQDSQASVSGHRKQVMLLRSILDRSVELNHEDSFHFFFCKLVNKVLVIKKSESVGDRIVKLVASFILSLHDEFAQDDEQEEQEEENIFTRFVNYFISHLLRGIESKDKNVRYRVVQFLDLAMSALGEIDDQLYETLLWALDKRLHDKEPSIRIKALHCVARFQETDEDNDNDYEIDEATAKLLTAIQNDSSAEVRRAALLNLVKTNTTKHYLLERAKDVNSINRRLVYSKVIKDFGDFRTIDSKIRQKLLAWGLKDREESVQRACIKMFAVDWLNTLDGDLIEFLQRLHITHSDIAELAMKQFFNYRKDILSKISFPKSIWLELTPEISFLARTFYYHCIEHSLNDIIDANYPESAELAALLRKYLEARKQLTNLEDAEDFDFVIEQLLKIGVDYDFSDEIGRREMLQVIRSSLSNDRLTDKLIIVALQVLKKLSINEKDFCAMVTEIITDIRDSDLLDQEEEDQESETQENEKNLIHSLSICKAMLKLTNEPIKDNLSLSSLIDTLINPAVRNTQSAIRELGTECLGLCCLLDLQLATDQLYLFGLCLSKGHEELKVIAIKALFDILSVHGTKVLDVPDGVDSLSFHKLLYRTLKDDELSEVQALCAEGLCKLYLSDILNDDELFETLILTYYNPNNSTNQSLLQAFTFCLPVYCFSHPLHQEKMAKVAVDAFMRLYIAHAENDTEDEAEMVEPATILQQIIHWTDPVNVVNQAEENINESRTHLIVGIDLLNSLDEVNSKKYKKLISINLSKLFIGTSLSYEDLKLLRETIAEKQEIFNELDQLSRNNINKLINKLKPLLEESKRKHEISKADIEEEAKDQEYSQILEHPDEEENSKDEVDEEFEKEQSQILQTSPSKNKDNDEHIGEDGNVVDDEEDANVEITTNDISQIVDNDGDLSME